MNNVIIMVDNLFMVSYKFNNNNVEVDFTRMHDNNSRRYEMKHEQALKEIASRLKNGYSFYPRKIDEINR